MEERWFIPWDSVTLVAELWYLLLTCSVHCHLVGTSGSLEQSQWLQGSSSRLFVGNNIQIMTNQNSTTIADAGMPAVILFWLFWLCVTLIDRNIYLKLLMA